MERLPSHVRTVHASATHLARTAPVTLLVNHSASIGLTQSTQTTITKREHCWMDGWRERNKTMTNESAFDSTWIVNTAAAGSTLTNWIIKHNKTRLQCDPIALDPC